jgi:hypothetical protein
MPRGLSEREQTKVLENHRIESSYWQGRETIRSLHSLFCSERDLEQKQVYRTKLREAIHCFVAFCVEHRIHLSIYVKDTHNHGRPSRNYDAQLRYDYDHLGGDLIAGFADMAMAAKGSTYRPLIQGPI